MFCFTYIGRRSRSEGGHVWSVDKKRNKIFISSLCGPLRCLITTFCVSFISMASLWSSWSLFFSSAVHSSSLPVSRANRIRYRCCIQRNRYDEAFRRSKLDSCGWAFVEGGRDRGGLVFCSSSFKITYFTLFFFYLYIYISWQTLHRVFSFLLFMKHHRYSTESKSLTRCVRLVN